MSEERFPMDGIEDAAPAAPQNDAPTPDQQQPQDDRPRDDTGRFAPKQEPGPRGQPDREAARRREAAERDEARREASDYKAKYEAQQKRLDDMSALARGDQPNEQQPDPLAEMRTKLDGIAETLQQRQEREAAAEAWGHVEAYANQDEAQFTAQTPDFPQATQHYIQSRLYEMKALGLDQPQAEAELQREAQELLVSCAQRRQSPSQMIYAMAQARGFSPGAPQMRDANPRPQPAQARPNAGGRSFGTGSGPAGGGLTAAQIAAMDESDYEAFRSTPEGRRAIQTAMRNGAAG